MSAAHRRLVEAGVWNKEGFRRCHERGRPGQRHGNVGGCWRTGLKAGATPQARSRTGFRIRAGARVGATDLSPAIASSSGAQQTTGSSPNVS